MVSSKNCKHKLSVEAAMCRKTSSPSIPLPKNRFTFTAFLPTGGRALNRGLGGHVAHRVPDPGPW